MPLVSNFQTHFRSSKCDEHINKIVDEMCATAIFRHTLMQAVE